MFYIHHKTTKKGILVPELSVCTKVLIRFISYDNGYTDLTVNDNDPQHTFLKLYISRVDKQRNEPGRWKSRIVAIFLLFLTLLHVLT